MDVNPEYIWIYDPNRRVYKRDGDGRAMDSPIYRESWIKCRVVSETNQSWVLDYGDRKVPKRKDKRLDVAFSELELDDIVWKNDNAYRVSEKVKRLDAETLKKVAELIGYEEV